MQRASKKGLHRRFYAKNRDRVLREKKEHAKTKRREQPTFGLRKAIGEARGNGNLIELKSRLEQAIAKSI